MGVWVLGVLAAAAGLAGPALLFSEARASSAPGSVVDAISLLADKTGHYDPSTFENLATNASISVTFTDHDTVAHTLNISSREGYVIPSNSTPAELAELFSQYPPLYSTSVGGYGETSVGSFVSPTAPGWYEFIDNTTGSFERGMVGFIAFGENLPTYLLPPNSGNASADPTDTIVLVGVGVSLIAEATFAAVLVRRIRRRRNEPPSGPPGDALNSAAAPPRIGTGPPPAPSPVEPPVPPGKS
jgi:hypothetical protein